MTRVLGLDLGGTNVKSVVLADGTTPTPSIEARRSDPTDADGGPEAVIRRLVEVGRALLDAHPSDAVGLGVPGLFDAVTGTIQLFPNLPGPWKDRPIRDEVSAALGVPVHLVNDARAFTLAEATLGAGQGASTVVAMGLGTGIGGGVVVGGQLHLGADGAAGEIGHQTIVIDGPLCGCGNRGCLEALAQTGRLCDLAGQTTTEEVFAAAATGDVRAQRALDEVIGYLAVGLANALVLLGPDRIVIGGGMAGAGEALLAPLRAELARRVTLVPPDRVTIVRASLGTWAGAIGAALWARSRAT